MRCNQRFFGQEHFERGTPERDFCTRLTALKPAFSQYDFAMRDRLPQLSSGTGGLAQVKYNGMLSIVMWDDLREGFVSWGPRGRCYYSLGDDRKHPVTEFFNERFVEAGDVAFVGETYVERRIEGKSHMTAFNRSMSIIKNPQSRADVDRIKLAVFDYTRRGEGGEFTRPNPKYIGRLDELENSYGFPEGCDSERVHLPDHMEAWGSLEGSRAEIQGFWDEYIGERGFEGLIIHTDAGEEYKIKFRDTLDVAIIAFRMSGDGRPVCEECGMRFDIFWMRKLARDGAVARSDWFDRKGYLNGAERGPWIQERMGECPFCGATLLYTAGPKPGAKIVLMTSNGDFVDIADGAQFSPISPVLDLIEPLYEEDGYLWVRPEVVIEVSYQDLYVDRPRPVYRFEEDRYVKVGSRSAVSLRPYGPHLREDKAVNPKDLRLEQVSYFVNRIKRIQERWTRALGATARARR